MTALMIGCIWHGLDALQGTRAKPGNHLVVNKGSFTGMDKLVCRPTHVERNNDVPLFAVDARNT